LAPSNLLPVSETNRQWGFYMYGKGVARDYAEAKRQFEQGADLGRGFCNERARGDLQRRRWGPPQCHRRATMVRESGALGNPEAKQNLKGMRR